MPIPVYKAKSKIQIYSSLNAPVGLAAMFATDSGTADIETELAIITSCKVMERVLERLDFFREAVTSEDSARIVLGISSSVDAGRHQHHQY